MSSTNIIPFCLIVLMTTFSCTSNVPNANIAAQVDSTIATTNMLLQVHNRDVIQTLLQKAEDAKTKYKAEFWLPKGQLVDSLMQKVLRYLDSLKSVFRMRWASKTGSRTVQTLFIEQGQGKKLYLKLQQLKKDLIAIDEPMKVVTDSLNLTGLTSIKVTSSDDFKNQFFTSGTPQETLTLLSSLQANILQAENHCLNFCLHQIFSYDSYTVMQAIAGQNTKILKAGDYLEITPGLGRFSGNPLPTISIGGKNIPTNEKGLAIYKFKTSKKVGNYSMPVIISYVDQDGKKQIITVPVEYSLVDSVIKK